MGNPFEPRPPANHLPGPAPRRGAHGDWLCRRPRLTTRKRWPAGSAAHGGARRRDYGGGSRCPAVTSDLCPARRAPALSLRRHEAALGPRAAPGALGGLGSPAGCSEHVPARPSGGGPGRAGLRGHFGGCLGGRLAEGLGGPGAARTPPRGTGRGPGPCSLCGGAGSAGAGTRAARGAAGAGGGGAGSDAGAGGGAGPGGLPPLAAPAAPGGLGTPRALPAPAGSLPPTAGMRPPDPGADGAIRRDTGRGDTVSAPGGLRAPQPPCAQVSADAVLAAKAAPCGPPPTAPQPAPLWPGHRPPGPAPYRQRSRCPRHCLPGAQSPDQQELLAQHGPARPVFVEGPFPLWLRSTRLSYYVLRGDPLPPHLREDPPDPERSLYYPLHLDLDLERGPWDDDDFDVEEVEEGPVFALCMVGAGDRHTLGKWIAGLQEANPVLGRTPVVFRLGDGEPTTAGAPGGHPVPRLEAAPARPVVLGPPDPPRGHGHSTSGDSRSGGGPGAPPAAPGE
ncbi:evolutionarily conserved signaling intermediate in Toll pathway, mitochondrial isoform X1 [Buteo buteo]|uniref:evolutionarily conserved signaling intermediate in Toll pathway, mitochondrial isoform X1 n=1 Tax=Buteo buteo TaxID=30397 RepID=UPI003EBB67CA